jgi:hypothetical protein
MFWDIFPPAKLNKEPKSLYQGFSGRSGFDSIQSRSWLRSARWSQMAGGKLGQIPIWGNLHLTLLAEYEAPQLVAQVFDLLRIAGRPKMFGQLVEGPLFLLLGFDSLLDEVHQHAVIAQIALLGQSFRLFRD